MPLIIIILILCILKYMDIALLANLSWWWIVALMFAAFIWFEFIERLLGLDKRDAHEQLEKARQARVKDAFKKK